MTNLFEGTNDDLIVDPNKNYYEELVGEGKRFKDNETLAKSKLEADAHAKRLEREQAELRKDYLALREQYQAVQSLNELIDKMGTSNRESPPSKDDDDNVGTPALKLEEIEKLVTSKLQETEAKRREEANLKLVTDKLKERYGENSANILKEQANSLGLDIDFVNNLARQHPTVFMKTFGLDQAPSQDLFQSPPASRQMPFSPSKTVRDEAYYDKLRKENPSEYWDPKTQVQMHKDAIAMGDAFFGKKN